MKAETLLPLGKLDPGLAKPEAPLDLTEVPNQAAQADAAGYHAVLMEETKDDPFQVLALAAQHTQQVHLGTSVAIAFARSPFVTAQAAWTAQKLSGGRFELGLGSQVRGHIRRRFGLQWHPPGPWMRDYVGALKALWHAWQHEQPIDYTSTRYDLNLNVPLFTPAPIQWPHIPIQIAAVNPYMCQVAAEVADGVRLHPVCTPRYINEVLRPRMRTVRDLDDGFEICLKPLVAAAATEAQLNERREVARQRLAFYLSTPAYANAFAGHGLGERCAQAAALSKQQQWRKLAALVDDEMLAEWAVVARYDDLADTILQRYDGLIDRIEVSIPVADDHDLAVLRDVVAAIA